jgi:hypothetical protein
MGLLDILRSTGTKPKATEKFKAAYDPVGYTRPQRKTFYPGQFTWKSRCSHYDKLTEQYPILKMGLFTLAGLITAQGVWFKPAVNKKDETYPLAEEALYRTEKFKNEQQVTSKFWETAFRMAKYGGCFWEVTDTPTFGFRIPPMQECIEPYSADEEGNITGWRQIVNGATTATWTSDELVLVPFLGATTDTWPYAPSLLTGLETETEMLVELEQSVKDYSEKQAWPYEILAMGDNQNTVSDDDYEVGRREWKNRRPGEGIATRNMPVQILPGGTGSAPIRELAVLCGLMKDNVVDATMVPPISKLYNSTEASAKVMTAHVMSTIGQPVQWRLAERFVDGVLKPWLEGSGFSRKSCPLVVFESPDANKKEEGEYWTGLVNAKIQSPMQACEHLGLEYDEDYWSEQVRLEQEKFSQQLKAKQESASNDANPKDVKVREGKSYKVTELFHEAHKHD